MKMKIFAGILAVLMITGYFLHVNSGLENNSVRISEAVQGMLDGEKVEDIFTAEQLKKLEDFREKFLEEDLSQYRVESFQPDDENVVYLMLIVKPRFEGESGIILYMTFELDDVESLKVRNIVISNWVNIEFSAKQF